MRRRKGRKSSKKSLMDSGENLSFTEDAGSIEDLAEKDCVKECMDGDDIDDKNVISRVKLF